MKGLSKIEGYCQQAVWTVGSLPGSTGQEAPKMSALCVLIHVKRVIDYAVGGSNTRSCSIAFSALSLCCLVHSVGAGRGEGGSGEVEGKEGEELMRRAGQTPREQSAIAIETAGVKHSRSPFDKLSIEESVRWVASPSYIFDFWGGHRLG
jgi:hypothetical protein